MASEYKDTGKQPTCCGQQVKMNENMTASKQIFLLLGICESCQQKYWHEIRRRKFDESQEKLLNRHWLELSRSKHDLRM